MAYPNSNVPGSLEDQDNQEVGRQSTPESRRRFEEQQYQSDAGHRQDVMDESRVKEKEILMAKLEQEILISGIKMEEADLIAFKDAVMEMINSSDPEAGAHIGSFLKRLDTHMDEAAQLREKGFNGDAINKTVQFLIQELKIIGKIQNKTTRDKVLTLLGLAIDPEKLESEVKSMAGKTGAAAIASFLPGGGLIDIYEAAKGKTVSGEKIGALGRTAKATLGSVSVGLDLATFGVGGKITKLVSGSKAASETIDAVKATAAIKKLMEMLSTVKSSTAMAKGITGAGHIVTLMGNYPKVVGAVSLAAQYGYKYKTGYKVAKALVKGTSIMHAGLASDKIDKATARTAINMHSGKNPNDNDNEQRRAA